LEQKPKQLGQKLAEFLEIPLETAIDWPKLMLSANQNLLLQNHRGVIEYAQNVVRVNTKLGEIKIIGQKLMIIFAGKDEIEISGQICQIEYVDWR